MLLRDACHPALASAGGDSRCGFDLRVRFMSLRFTKRSNGEFFQRALDVDALEKDCAPDAIEFYATRSLPV